MRSRMGEQRALWLSNVSFRSNERLTNEQNARKFATFLLANRISLSSFACHGAAFGLN
jgi:hypothetical protein